MNAVIAFCGLAAAGWVSPDLSQPIAPTRDSIPSQPSYSTQTYSPSNYPRPSYPQASSRPVGRPSSGAVRRSSRIPFAPTDPRASSNENIPLPPTSSDPSYLPSAGNGGPAEHIGSQQMAENGGRHAGSQKAFDRYTSPPATSPYAMMSGSTADGTVDRYSAYVRPALDQQRVNQEDERALSNIEGGMQPGPAPYYPPAFLNYGSYFPGYSAR
jgi:hypothetical protein